MIREIKEKFPLQPNGKPYATLEKATATFNDMGEKTITTQVKIDGQITPDFTTDWELEFRGERYVMPLRQPQASKDNDSLSSKVDLTFQHWAQYQLKRWYFYTIQSEVAGVAVADKYIASVSLTLSKFVDLFSQILESYYGDAITIDLNPNYIEKAEPTYVDINYSYMWDVLIKLYELYGVRWEIVPNGDSSHYKIMVAYDTKELDHIFEYGFEGGLLKVERQVQDDNIRNILLGRGGEKNLPFRYFKNYDPNNPSFPADPDWVKELANVYFDRLRSAEFRSYVQGWKNGRWSRDGYDKDEYSRKVGYDDTAVKWAWVKGYGDGGNINGKFAPVEFVGDKIITVDTMQTGDKHIEIVPGYYAPIRKGSSIYKFGPLLGGLENNDEIYPSIQGVDRGDLRRVDQVVAVQQVDNDGDDASLVKDSVDMYATDLPDFTFDFAIKGGEKKTIEVTSPNWRFTVPHGYVANLTNPTPVYVKSLFYNYFIPFPSYGGSPSTGGTDYHDDESNNFIVSNSSKVFAVDASGERHPLAGLGEGTYTLLIEYDVENTGRTSKYEGSYEAHITVKDLSITFREERSTPNPKNTFDIWIKNIWETKFRDNNHKDETEEQYVKRVWESILGDHLGEEAAICFASGDLSISEDYEFKIAGKSITTGIHYDTSKVLEDKDTGDVFFSEWRITCYRSDADYDSLGVMTPNTKRQGKGGDYFYFVGIELPQDYVEWAEQREHDYKEDQLLKTKDISPTWVVGLDKVRIGTPKFDDTVALIEQLRCGGSIRLADKRFIPVTEGQAYLTMYVKTLTYKFNEKSDTAGLTPDVEITLSNDYEVTANPVATIQSDISAIQRQIGSSLSLSTLQQVVRMVGDRIYLRKDGISDRSISKTYFAELIASLGFRQGMVGGTGWSCYKDENGKWVIETDRLNVRDEMQVNTLVINQIQARGGMIIESLASLEITKATHEGDRWRCYFDTKNGSVANLFKVNDIAYCNRFTSNDKQLKYYKRRVIEVNEDNVALSIFNDVDGSGAPEEGDVIVHFGNYVDKERQFVIIRDMMGGGYERMLSGLNSVSAVGTEYYFAGHQSTTGERFFIGNKETGQYIEYKDGKLYIPGQLILGQDTGNGQSMIDYIESLISSSKSESESFAQTLVDKLGDDLQNQIDGIIETWFGDGAPTMSNYPVTEWERDQYPNHLGDLYYDNSTGNAYRFSRSVSGIYSWVVIEDSAVVKALADAAKAQDTADNKRRVFTDTPYTPYDVGDLWVNANFHNGQYMFTNDILRCKTSRQSGDFWIFDWEKASNYTDDSALDRFKSEYSKEIEDIKGQVDGKAETWYQSTDPSVNWKTEDEKLLHIGDLWYNTTNGTTWCWRSTGWEEMSIPESVFDTIDGKADIYVTQPNGYRINDLWFLDLDELKVYDGTWPKGTLLVARVTRKTGFVATDWAKKDRYTDDTAANEAKARLNSWAEDGVISPTEKNEIKDEIARIDSDYWVIINGFQDYELGLPESYMNAYEKYRLLLMQLSADEPEVIPIPDEFADVQAQYYLNRHTALSLINNSPKDYADGIIAGYEYIKEALTNGQTQAKNGLLLTSLIQLGTWSSSGIHVYSGINGIPSSKYPGYSIAAWYGGDMYDRENPIGDIMPLEARYAKALFRFDGSGYLADGKISWSSDGSGKLADGKISWSSDGTLQLNNGLKIQGGEEGVTATIESIVNTINNFTANFKPHVKTSTGSKAVTWAEVNGISNKLYAVECTAGFFSDEFISAKGENGDTSGDGISKLNVSFPNDIKNFYNTSEKPTQVYESNRGIIGNARCLDYSNSRYLIFETIYTIASNNTFVNGGTTLKTYVTKRTNGAWGDWSVLKEENLP